MTVAELEYAEKRMKQKWYDLVMAEQQGASTKSLERLYNSYILAMEEYNRCSEEYQREQEAEHGLTPVPQKKTTKPSKTGGQKRLAS